jgi:LuxR family maltose regulon positive regulatory protein
VASTVTPAVGLIEAKTMIPILRSGLVERKALVAQLEGSGDFSVVSVGAPAGYGKTTVLAQWAESDLRPFAWLTLDERDNDPVLLLRYVVASLERAGLVDQTGAPGKRALRSLWASLVPDVCRALSDVATPFVLVFDDVHYLHETEARDVLAVAMRSIPPGSQLVLSGRRELTSIVAPMRARGELFDVGLSELKFTRGETRKLLAGAGASLTTDEVEDLRRHAEGWPAGLYLNALALWSSGSAARPIGGDLDRFVEDYLREEHLNKLSSDELDFLTRSSVLERMSAEICDAVLGLEDSGATLRALEQSNLFLIPLDRERHWYRYHELFRQALLHQLADIDSDAASELRSRAADWCEAQGLLEDAMTYASAADDKDRMSRLLLTLAFPLYRSGRMATVEGWLAKFYDAASVNRYPAVAVIGAVANALKGSAFRAERWLDAARRAPEVPGGLPDGSSSLRPWIATAEAMLCRHGPGRMREDAAIAIAELGPLSPFRAPAMFYAAMATLLEGDAEDADRQFEDVARAAEESGAVFAGVVALAQRTLLALARADLGEARALLARAHALAPRETFADYMPMALLLVAEACYDLQVGDRDGAARALVAAQRLRPYLTHATPYYAVQTQAEMARAYLALGDTNAARATLVDAADVLRHRPDLGILGNEIAVLQERAAAADRPDSGWASSLTKAELRLLPLLTTHLSFREIGQRLFVSRNTVKTQAISIYRKVGANSRAEAVERAVELGLVEQAVRDAEQITRRG